MINNRGLKCNDIIYDQSLLNFEFILSLEVLIEILSIILPIIDIISVKLS